MITAVIGANYGDEGKGLAVNYFTREGRNLVVRHNGGAQSGHTVEEGDKRFVFHELSSGSFNGAATYWSSTYHPDLYAFSKEYDDLYKLTGKTPEVYAAKDTKITLIDDVFLNCFKETQKKAGSCGMGIWECVVRNNAGFAVTVGQVKELNVRQLYSRLLAIRVNYTLKRLKVLKEKFGGNNEYEKMLLDNTILLNYAADIKHNAENICVIDSPDRLFDQFDNVVFEGGQGLLLDGDYDTEHGTPSKTGLYNVLNDAGAIGRKIDEVVYVTRTYLTRHGRGNFVAETDLKMNDETNVFNEWQENIRYGEFDSIASLEDRIRNDCRIVKPHLFVTHADITDGKMLTSKGNIDIGTLGFEKIYVADNRFTVGGVINKR